MTDGSSFTAILQTMELFPSYCIHMLEIGELTGRLDTVLTALSDHYRRERTLNETIQWAVTYPYAMVALTALIFLIPPRWIFPIFSQVFSLSDSGMSPAASLLLEQNPAGLAIPTGAAVALFPVTVPALILLHSQWGLATFSRRKSSAVIGQTRFASTMLLMISNGFGMNEALEQIGKLLEETPLASVCTDYQKRANDGVPFTGTVTGSDVSSGMEAGMLTMGLRTDVMENVVEELARRGQLNADVWLNQSLSRFEYGLMILLCVTVGGMLLTVTLLLLQMLASLRGRT